MFQLNFYPHLDVHHTAFRAVCIGTRAPVLPIEGYRILDFFLTFPFELKIVRSRGSKLKKLAASFEIYRPYRWASDPLYTFLQMFELQTVAVGALVRNGTADKNAFENDRLRLSDDCKLRAEMRVQVEDFLSTRTPVIDAVLDMIEKHGLTGRDGLKARSGLMPYKYDLDDNVLLN